MTSHGRHHISDAKELLSGAETRENGDNLLSEDPEKNPGWVPADRLTIGKTRKVRDSMIETDLPYTIPSGISATLSAAERTKTVGSLEIQPAVCPLEDRAQIRLRFDSHQLSDTTQSTKSCFRAPRLWFSSTPNMFRGLQTLLSVQPQSFSLIPIHTHFDSHPRSYFT